MFAKSLKFILLSVMSLVFSFELIAQMKTLPKNVAVFNGIPSAFISLGAYHPTYAMVVEKNLHRLSVFKLLPDGNYTVVKTYLAITGKEQGDKKFRGDNRTPEGIYFIVDQKSGADLVRKWGEVAKKYGPKAFVLDYPNIFDKRQRKTGSGIWIHGVESDSRILKAFDTEGCVALRNLDILDISQYITAFQTPVVIVDEMQTISKEAVARERQRVLEMVESWRMSWQKSEFKTYLSYYSEQFQTLGKNKNKWYAFKEKLSTLRNGNIRVEISDPKILAFRNQLLVEFFQKYSSPDKEDYGRKFLYLRQEGMDFKIIAEKWYPASSANSEIAVISDSQQKK